MESMKKSPISGYDTVFSGKNQIYDYGFIHDREKTLFWKYDGSSVHKLIDPPETALDIIRKNHECPCAGILTHDGTLVSFPLGTIKNNISAWQKKPFPSLRKFCKSPDRQKKLFTSLYIGIAVQTLPRHLLSDFLLSFRHLSKTIPLRHIRLFLGIFRRQSGHTRTGLPA